MSIWEKMPPLLKVLMGMGFLLIIYGYIALIIQGKLPSPIDDMSIGLGFIGIALSYAAFK